MFLSEWADILLGFALESVYYAESIETVADNLGEAHPSIVVMYQDYLKNTIKSMMV